MTYVIFALALIVGAAKIAPAYGAALPPAIENRVDAEAGLFNAQYMTRMARIALMPPKAMRCRPSETL